MDNLENSVRMLNDNITRLFDLFSAASRDVSDDTSLKSLNQKIDKLISQQEEIADAILSIKMLVDEKKKETFKPMVSDNFSINPTPNTQFPARDPFSQPISPQIMPPRPQTEPLRPIGAQSSIPSMDRMPPPPVNPLGKTPRRF